MLMIDKKLKIIKSRTSYTIISEKLGIGRSTVAYLKKNAKPEVFKKKKMVDMGFKKQLLRQ